VRPVLAAIRAELFHLETLSGRLLVLRAGVVPIFTFLALEGNDFSWHLLYSRALAMRSDIFALKHAKATATPGHSATRCGCRRFAH
jgi:hypothetical protein